MTSSLKLISFLIIFIFYSPIQAQIHVSGQIIGAKDSLPIPEASVYFDGTSIGVSSDDAGHFNITTNKNISSDLIINALGYKTRVIRNKLQKQDLGVIYLEESQESLGEVYLKSETDPWSRQRKLDIFRKEFLGNSAMAIQCQILNEDVLVLKYIPSSKTLVASAHSPLKIINKYLGYEITYNLTDFKAEFSFSGEERFTELVYIEGSSYFEELRPQPLPRFLRHREKVFYGSYLHFMRSLANKELTENGFRTFNEITEVLPYKYFIINKSSGLTEVRLQRDKLWIMYKRQGKSSFQTNGIFFIDSNGNSTPPQNVMISGKMGLSRIAGLLPLNYKLD